jgi:type I restriction enzyme S subunit
MKVRLSELIRRVKIPIKILDKQEYSLVTIRMNNKGIKLREKKLGALIGTKSLYEVREGQFALSGIDARNGAYGIVPAELSGAVVSNDFWTHEINEKKVDINFFSILISTDEFLLCCQKASEGTTNRQRLQANVFYNLEFDIPSLSEQKIFAKKILDGKETSSKLFEELTSQQTLITQLRQSILLEAVQGKLVKQNKKDEPASELLKRIKAEKEKIIKQGKLKLEKPLPPIAEIEIPYKLPEGWIWCRLGDIVSKMEYGTSEKSSVNNDVPVLGMGNIQEGKLVFDKLKYVSKKIKDLPKLYLKKHDLIFNRTNSFELVGKSAIYLEKDNEFTLASYLIRVAFSLSNVSVEYVVNYINSPICRRTQIEPQITQQTGQANFSGGKLKEILFPLPPLPEQKRIVEKVNQLMQHCNELEQQSQQSKTHAQQLMQAVLRDVFEGKKEQKIIEKVGVATDG